MWPRVIAGVVLCLVGGLWIAQGVGAAKGSPMTGHSGYAFLGAAVVAGGVGLLVWAARLRGSGTEPPE
jgi:hypothetical protein